MRALVVEDDPLMSDFAVRVLETLGFECVTATNAEAALAALVADEDIGLLFADVRLSQDCDGVGLAVRARAMQGNLHVLLTSGYGNAASGTAAAFDFLAKPYRKKDLAAKLAHLRTVG